MIQKSELIHFLKQILGKWTLWLFVVLDIVGALAQFFIPNFSLPTNVYGFLAVIGFFWAGFQVYNDTKASYEKTLETNRIQYEKELGTIRTQMEKLSGEINVNAILKNPLLDLTLQESHEYTFEIDKKNPSLNEAMYDLTKSIEKSTKNAKRTKTTEVPYFLPNAQLSIFLRIQNIGCNLDILSVVVNWGHQPEFPYEIYSATAIVSSQGKVISYPLRLNADDTLECSIWMKIAPRTFHTAAQFASRLREIRDKQYFLNGKILVETADPAGDRTEFTTDVEISPIPLVNLYIEAWRKENRTELMRLAGINI